MRQSRRFIFGGDTAVPLIQGWDKLSNPVNSLSASFDSITTCEHEGTLYMAHTAPSTDYLRFYYLNSNERWQRVTSSFPDLTTPSSYFEKISSVSLCSHQGNLLLGVSRSYYEESSSGNNPPTNVTIRIYVYNSLTSAWTIFANLSPTTVANSWEFNDVKLTVGDDGYLWVVSRRGSFAYYHRLNSNGTWSQYGGEQPLLPNARGFDAIRYGQGAYSAGYQSITPYLSVSYCNGTTNTNTANPPWTGISYPSPQDVCFCVHEGVLNLASPHSVSPYLSSWYYSGSAASGTWVKRSNPNILLGSTGGRVAMYSFERELYLVASCANTSRRLESYYLSETGLWTNISDLPQITSAATKMAMCGYKKKLYLVVGHSGSPYVTTYKSK